MTTGQENPQIQIPVAPSTELAITSVNALRAEMAIRHDAIQQRLDMMDAFAQRQHEDLVRVPTEVQKATMALRELLETEIAKTAAELAHTKGRQIEAVHGEITTAIARVHGEIREAIAQVEGHIQTRGELADERFKGIQTQLALLREAASQLETVGKEAIQAALLTQKEMAAETQKSSQAAIAKSESATSEAIKALTSTMNAANEATNSRINDLKGRLDRGEGKTSVTDPAVGAALGELSQGIKTLNRGVTTDKDRWSYVIGAVGFISLVAAIIFILLTRQ